MRLYDACHVHGVDTPRVPPAQEAQFAFTGWRDHPPVFIADEIATGLVEDLVVAAKSGGNLEQVEDVHRGLIPPYTAFMVEAHLGDALAASKDAQKLFLAPEFEHLTGGEQTVLVGASTSAMDLSQRHTFRPEVQGFLNSYQRTQTEIGRWYDPKWLFSTRTLVWVPELWTQPVGWVSLHLTQVDAGGDELGTHTFTIADDLVAAGIRSGEDLDDYLGDGSERQYGLLRLMYAQLGVLAHIISAYTLGYLGAVNVETTEHRSPLQRQQRRSVERREGVPYQVTYKTLDVVSGSGQRRHRRALTTLQGRSREAAHMVRGHLKTYTEEAPLFGRHVGTWYWPPHVRGSETDGQIVKDYRVRTAPER